MSAHTAHYPDERESLCGTPLLLWVWGATHHEKKRRTRKTARLRPQQRHRRPPHTPAMLARLSRASFTAKKQKHQGSSSLQQQLHEENAGKHQSVAVEAPLTSSSATPGPEDEFGDAEVLKELPLPQEAQRQHAEAAAAAAKARTEERAALPQHTGEEVDLVCFWAAQHAALHNSFEVGFIDTEIKKRPLLFEGEVSPLDSWPAPPSARMEPNPARRTRARAAAAVPPPPAARAGGGGGGGAPAPTDAVMIRVAPRPTPGCKSRVRVVPRPPALDLTDAIERLEWGKVWPQAWS